MEILTIKFLQGLFGIHQALAQGTGQNPGIQIKNPLNFNSLECILQAIAGFLFTISIPIVTIMVLWAGFQILTAAGNPNQIDRGKKTLLWAAMGFVVILIAGGIADLIANILGGGKLPRVSCH